MLRKVEYKIIGEKRVVQDLELLIKDFQKRYNVLIKRTVIDDGEAPREVKGKETIERDEYLNKYGI